VSGILQPQPWQHIIILPHHHPQITLIWVKLASSVKVQGYTHMPIHSIWVCSNTFYIYNMDVEKKWVVFYSLNHDNTSLFHPTIPRLPKFGPTWPEQQCKGCAHIPIHSIRMSLSTFYISLYQSQQRTISWSQICKAFFAFCILFLCSFYCMYSLTNGIYKIERNKKICEVCFELSGHNK
jgi:hypothetical protein